ncbi:MAG: hypothetical protein K2H01_07955 [Ruminococcus sp.]|nr:hypothetical protein [Ruminococcus sp.]
MKKHRIAAIFMGAVISVQCLAAITAHAAEKEINDKEKIIGQLHENDDITALMLLTDGVSDKSRETVLPEYYDLRQKGIATSVKDQGAYGDCWSFSAMNSIESSLIKKESYIDLSEWMTAYYTYCDKFGFPWDDEIGSLFDAGGTYNYISAMLAAGIGAFKERSDKWYYGDETIIKDKSTADAVRKMRDYQITNIEYFPYWHGHDVLPDQIHAIKNVLYSDHSLVINYAHFDDCYNEESCSYCTAEKYIYYEDKPFHSVSLVGWDDDYPAENFLNVPDSDGAWLCKNSWGEDWGGGGYFWLSYTDPTIYEAFYFDAEPVKKYSDIHVYDDYGATNMISAYGNDESEYDYLANVFTAEEDCFVTAAMISTVNTDENYEITVYSGLTDPADPCSGKPGETIKGVISNVGYHTIDFESPVYVGAGESYSVVVKLGGEMGYHIACEGYIDCKAFYEDGTSEEFLDDMGKYISRDFSKGQSFISNNGINWSDNYENGLYISEIEGDGKEANEDGLIIKKYVYYENIANNSIKTFTKPADAVVFSEYSSKLPLGAKISLSAPCGGTIKYSVNGGEYKTYTEPITFNGDMTISAYTNKNNVYQKSYVQQKAELSCILICKNGKCKYIYETDEGTDNYVEYLYNDEKSVDIQLISTGNMSAGDTNIKSGLYYTISTENENNVIVIDVSEKGKLDSKYTINFVKITPVIGDVKIDGVINIADATAVLRMYAMNAAGIIDDSFSEQQYSNADVNKDGNINIEDATLILIYYAENAVGLKTGS